jgi:hypothetical protein
LQLPTSTGYRDEREKEREMLYPMPCYVLCAVCNVAHQSPCRHDGRETEVIGMRFCSCRSVRVNH